MLCKTKNSLIAEYTLRNSQSPIGVSEYRLAEPLPEELRKNLPTIEKLEKELKEAPFFFDVSDDDAPSIENKKKDAKGTATDNSKETVLGTSFWTS